MAVNVPIPDLVGEEINGEKQYCPVCRRCRAYGRPHNGRFLSGVTIAGAVAIALHIHDFHQGIGSVLHWFEGQDARQMALQKTADEINQALRLLRKALEAQSKSDFRARPSGRARGVYDHAKARF